MSTKHKDFQFSIESEVHSFQVRPDGKIWMHSLGDWFQEIAWRHANSGGFGLDIQADNLMWAMARLDIKAFRLPEWGEKFRLHTAGRGVNKIFAFREFLLTDLDGKELVQGMSSWLLLDSQSKRPKRPEKVLPPELFDPTVTPEWEPAKLNNHGDLKRESLMKVIPNDLDLNNHVNNTSYIRWAENLIFDEIKAPMSCEINFLAETHLGDDVKLDLTKDQEAFFVKGEVNSKASFLSRWR